MVVSLVRRYAGVNNVKSFIKINAFIFVYGHCVFPLEVPEFDGDELKKLVGFSVKCIGARIRVPSLKLIVERSGKSEEFNLLGSFFGIEYSSVFGFAIHPNHCLIFHVDFTLAYYSRNKV